MRTLILAVLIVMCPGTAGAQTYLYTGAWSEHLISDEDYNERHDLIAIEHKRWMVGRFVNSYSDDTFFAAYKWPWQAGHWELSVIAGAMHGYRDCKDPNTGKEKTWCPLIAPAAVYTKHRVQPGAVLLGEALAGTVRWEF